MSNTLAIPNELVRGRIRLLVGRRLRSPRSKTNMRPKSNPIFRIRLIIQPTPKTKTPSSRKASKWSWQGSSLLKSTTRRVSSRYRSPQMATQTKTRSRRTFSLKWVILALNLISSRCLSYQSSSASRNSSSTSWWRRIRSRCICGPKP